MKQIPIKWSTENPFSFTGGHRTMPNLTANWFRDLPFDIQHALELIAQDHHTMPDDTLRLLIRDALADVDTFTHTCSHRFHQHATPYLQNIASSPQPAQKGAAP